MQRQNIIILEQCPATYECWGSLKRACEAHGWKYNTISKKKLPFTYNGWTVRKVAFNELSE